MRSYIAIDGGTTNTRAYWVEDGKVTDSIRLPYGSNPKDTGYLKNAVHDAIGTLCDQHGTPVCVLGCGMLTSEFGLAEVKHLPAPAGIGEFHRGMVKADLPEVTVLPLYLIPGIRVSDGTYLGTDMMRGEETELIGLCDKLEYGCVYVLPGSHSKILRVDERGRIVSVRTFLTGEMHAALVKDTVLASSVRVGTEPDTAFLKMGYDFTREHGINEALLKIRVMDTQFHLPERKIYGFYLGCILEGEVSEIVKVPENRVVIGGQPQLKAATAALLAMLCNKAVLPLPDDASRNAAPFGMVRIYEYQEKEGSV